jgi:ABC-type oligopeptide transport system substrate-binding subunit
MEWTAFLAATHSLDYKGFAQGVWGADYMDPNTFLDLFYAKDSNGDSGWYDPAYQRMIDNANGELDPKKRYEMLARAEAYLMTGQPFLSMATASTNFMKKPYVKGFYPNPQSLYAWKFVYIENDPAKWDQGPPKMTE